MTTKKAIMWLFFWIAAALIFDLGIYLFMGPQQALEFLGGYVIEQTLSIDNLFLFLMVFSCFKIPAMYQRRVLNYGILGAIIMRLIFVILGASLVNKFHWILYLFGAILIYSGLKMVFKREENHDFSNSKILILLNKFIPITDKLEGESFFVKKDNILYATPLLAILVLIEGTDLMFAIDSIPAIFSITTNPFIIYTSNLFAILGLRNLYFLLERLSNICKYVKYGVALILVFTGAKLLLLSVKIEISIIISLTVIFSILFISIIASIPSLKKIQTNART